jgi:subtilisin-like proprotein convertase family protein
MKTPLLVFASTALLALPAAATLFSTNWSAPFLNGTMVPDNNLSGWSDTRSFAGLSGTIQDISVTLNLGGGWNGDLYAYLAHDSGFAVLLDRVGYSGSGYGYGDAGFDVTLNLSGNPIGTYQAGSYSLNGNGQLTGDWAAHGALGSFLGVTPNGSWSLFVADYSSGGVTTVTSWGLEMNIVAVPEVEAWVGAALAGAFGAFWLNRQIWGKRSRLRSNSSPT